MLDFRTGNSWYGKALESLSFEYIHEVSGQQVQSYTTAELLLRTAYVAFRYEGQYVDGNGLCCFILDLLDQQAWKYFNLEINHYFRARLLQDRYYSHGMVTSGMNSGTNLLKQLHLLYLIFDITQTKLASNLTPVLTCVNFVT